VVQSAGLWLWFADIEQELLDVFLEDRKWLQCTRTLHAVVLSGGFGP
jgi:hypothetical protein